MAGCECPPRYLRTIPGLLKIAEIILTILTFAISFGCRWETYGGGWVEFAGILCFIVVTIWFLLHLINCIPQLFRNFLVEFISYCVMTAILFIAGIVAAAKADWYWPGQPICPSTIGATAFFGFASAVACGADAILLFLEYRRGSVHSSSATTTVTTTTTSASATQVQY